MEEDSMSRGEDDPDQEPEQDHDTEDDTSGPSNPGPHNIHSASTRQLRNQAEKNRRDKLNAYISQLSHLVPIINYSPKKLDKTSILRLTATYIRLKNVGLEAQQNHLNLLPEFLHSINWCESILEDIGGSMMLIVTGAGKIIYISSAVEKILGHTMIELMGHSLFSITCLEDHAELKRNLSPNGIIGAGKLRTDIRSLDDSDSDSSCDPVTSPLQINGPEIINDNDIIPERKSFYIRLRQRAVSKSDQPQYELVHILGHLRVPVKKHLQPSSSKRRDQTSNSNDVILVAVAKPLKEKRLTHLSLAEAYREEFITRHAVDGSIIYTDHRISTVSGYLAEEVVGTPGFKFMHRDDMRWTMVALRQMYYRGYSYGTSVYRLQTRTGEFIYMKTHGYLEINEAIDDVQSFLCINTVVSEDEGFGLVHKMKDCFAPLVAETVNEAFALIFENHLNPREIRNGEDALEEPEKVQLAIQQMLANIPSFHLFSDETSGLDNEDLTTRQKLAQAQILAKTMPPAAEQAAKLGLTAPPLSTSSSLVSSPNSVRSPKTPVPKTTPPPPPAPNQLNRPSVLRHAPRPQNSKFQVPNEVSVVVKRLRTDEHGAHNIVVNDGNNVGCRAGVVVTAGKRKHEEEITDWGQEIINRSNDTGLPLPPVTFCYQQPTLQQPITPLIDLQQPEVDNSNHTHLLDTYLKSFPGLGDHLDDEYGSLVSHAENQVWDKPDKLETELFRSHYTIDSNLGIQESQINEIEQAIDTVSRHNVADQVLNSSSLRLTSLKNELEIEKQELYNLRQDHQSIQHGLI